MWFKDMLLNLLKRSEVTTKDLIKANVILQYPDLINRIVKVEERTFFSEVCVDYLSDVSHQSEVLCLSLGHLVQKYLNPNGRYFNKDVLNVEHNLLKDAKVLHKADTRNIVIRDAEFRKVIKFYIPEINSIDCSYAIALLQQITTLGDSNVK